eukprot:gb/GECG01005400.1/.p1 GENE.gb/GECG01005400.1/~~gb/GECG01005400.1/.p1  ORF type:complete len:711 (+),score=107.63 gb/GECG01005400.1/:1-2133(+)
MKTKDNDQEDDSSIRVCPMCGKKFPAHVSDTDVYIHADRCVEHSSRRRKSSTPPPGYYSSVVSRGGGDTAPNNPFKKFEPGDGGSTASSVLYEDNDAKTKRRKKKDTPSSSSEVRRALSPPAAATEGKQYPPVTGEAAAGGSSAFKDDTTAAPSAAFPSRGAAGERDGTLGYQMPQSSSLRSSTHYEPVDTSAIVSDLAPGSVYRLAMPSSSRDDPYRRHTSPSTTGKRSPREPPEEIMVVKHTKYSNYPSGLKPDTGIPLLLPMGGHYRANDLWLSMSSKGAQVEWRSQSADPQLIHSLPYSDMAVRELNKKRTSTITQFARDESSNEEQIEAFHPMYDPDYNELFETPLIPEERDTGATETLWSGEWVQFIFAGIVLIGKVLSVERKSNKVTVYKARLWSSGHVVDVPASLAYRVRGENVDANFCSWSSIVANLKSEFNKSKDAVQWKWRTLSKAFDLKPYSFYTKFTRKYIPGEDTKADAKVYCCERWDDCNFNVVSIMRTVLEKMTKILRGVSYKHDSNADLTHEALLPAHLLHYRDVAVEGTIKAFEHLIETETRISFNELRESLREQFFVWLLTRCWNIHIHTPKVFNPSPMHMIPNASEYVAWEGCTKDTCALLRVLRQNTISSAFYSSVNATAAIPAKFEHDQGKQHTAADEKDSREQIVNKGKGRKRTPPDSDLKKKAIGFLKAIDAPVEKSGNRAGEVTT